jgi:fructose-1,6-bisphosphatase/inositol monophosphatase family enzyme
MLHYALLVKLVKPSMHIQLPEPIIQRVPINRPKGIKQCASCGSKVNGRRRIRVIGCTALRLAEVAGGFEQTSRKQAI